MEKVIHICDKCGTEKIYKQQSGDSEFRKVKFLVGRKGHPYVSDEIYSSNVATKTEILLCEECQNKLGIHGIEKQDTSFYKQPELIDRVFDLFADIADELGYVRSE